MKRDPRFPLEWARLIDSAPIVLLMVVLCFGHGYSIKGPLYGPMIIQFFTGFTANWAMNANSTYLLDLYPNNTASISALSNGLRCCLSAVATVTVNPLLRGIGPENTFIITFGLTMVAWLSLLCTIKWASIPREARQRMAQEETVDAPEVQGDSFVARTMAAFQARSIKLRRRFLSGKTGPKMDEKMGQSKKLNSSELTTACSEKDSSINAGAEAALRSDVRTTDDTTTQSSVK
jgi:hypothetical protein